MFRIALALLIGGGVVLFLGYREFQLSSAADEEPQLLSCAALGRDGPGDNAHVEVGRFIFADFFVYSAEEGNEQGPYEELWIPGVPIDGPYARQLHEAWEAGAPEGDLPEPKQVKVIFKFKDVRNDAHLQKLGDRETLTGLVVNRIDPLSREDKRLLRQGYDNVDFDSCWIVAVNRKPASDMVVGGYFAGGAALILAGGGLLFRSFSRRRDG